MASDVMAERAGAAERSEQAGAGSQRARRRDMGLPRRLMLVFAIACGLVAANLY